MSCRHLISALLVGLFCVAGRCDELPSITRLSIDGQGDVEGRLLAEDTGGQWAIENEFGRISLFPSASVTESAATENHFKYAEDKALGVYLQQMLGDGFSIQETPHFVLCGNTDEAFFDFSGKLLESVVRKYVSFCKAVKLPADLPGRKLPVVLMRDAKQFVNFAEQTHPETSFEATPGFYSVRYNFIVLTSPPGTFRTTSDLLKSLRRNRRHVETIVHECVHQLACNSGLQTRYSDYPLWLAEGLATYFEPASGRSAVLWSQYGGANGMHLPTLKRGTSVSLPLPLSDLVSQNERLIEADGLRVAYAEAWALTHYLANRKRTDYGKLLKEFSKLAPLQAVPPAEKLRRTEAAIGQPLSDLQRALESHIRRVR